MQSLRPLVEEGIVRRAAVSNYTLAQWQEAERALRHPVYADQIPFSLVKPRPADDLVPYAAAMGRLVVAYSPLGQGVLARVGAGSEGAPNPIRRFNPLWRGAAAERLLPLQVAVRDIAEAHGATPAQVALAWVVSHPNTVAIPGARTEAQLAENAAAADLVLDPAELDRLAQAAAVFA
jgi:aryl-alcohol dehydrogenase-like predicted oxidoreductase